MGKLELMKKFMNTFVGNGFHLKMRTSGNILQVHTIEIMQKVDETCPIDDIPVGDHFLHLIATNQVGAEASIVCNWSQDLLRNLLEHYKIAKEAGLNEISMFNNPLTNDMNNWMIASRNHRQVDTMRPAQ